MICLVHQDKQNRKNISPTQGTGKAVTEQYVIKPSMLEPYMKMLIKLVLMIYLFSYNNLCIGLFQLNRILFMWYQIGYCFRGIFTFNQFRKSISGICVPYAFG